LHRMAVPFLNNRSKRIDQIVAVDLGARQTKAVHLQSRSERLTLLGYAVQEAPDRDKGLTPEALGEHLKGVFKALGDRTHQTALAVGVPDAFLRHAELPSMPVGEMRQMLRLNSKTHLQQEYPDHVFDCSILVSKTPPAKQEGARVPGPVASQKQKVLVGGTKRQTLDDLRCASRAAGLNLRLISPGMLGPANAFELADPEAFAKQVVGLVDIGFRHSTIAIGMYGELAMNRVVSVGGDHLTASLVESLGISYAEAEGIKVGMPTEVQQNLEVVLASLGRELRASIDFFEHHHDLPVNQVFLSGGSARSEFLVRCLQTELMVPCKMWNPVQNFELSLPVEQRAGLEQVAPQLAVAIGTAVAAL
jgi:type IV pilus assembly protein PilM